MNFKDPLNPTVEEQILFLLPYLELEEAENLFLKLIEVRLNNTRSK